MGTHAGLIPVVRSPEALADALVRLAAQGCSFDTARLRAAGIPTSAVAEMAAAVGPLLRMAP